MRDCEKLAKALRCCHLTSGSGCAECPRRLENNDSCYKLLPDAADAIEELLAAVRSVVRCKECEWWAKQEASIQGRCARLAIYPTGEFYCASGSKPEPPKEDADANT